MYWELLKVYLPSVPDAFEQMLGLFCCYLAFIYPSWNVLRLGRFCLNIQSTSILVSINKGLRSKICFYFLFVYFMVFAEGNSSISLGDLV